MISQKKQERYERLFKQLEQLLQNSPHSISRMATALAVLHHKMPVFSWTGFYFIRNNQLEVGPYQGHVACQILPYDKGVCWAAIQQNKTLIVPDVRQFPGHIACDSRSKSEIVVPVFLSVNKAKPVGVLDVDSHIINAFDETDAIWLEKITQLIFSDIELV